MIKLYRWLMERLFHKNRDDEILRSIELHRQLTIEADKTISDFIATLDGEFDWLICNCHEKPEKKENENATISNAQRH